MRNRGLWKRFAAMALIGCMACNVMMPFGAEGAMVKAQETETAAESKYTESEYAGEESKYTESEYVGEESVPDDIDPAVTPVDGMKIEIGVDADGFRIRDGKLLQYAGCSHYVEIPEGVTRIGAGAFCENYVKRVVIPEGVTYIERGAFEYCSLEEVELPESLTGIGNFAFSRTPLKSVTIPKGVTEIGTKAFERCEMLEDIELLNNSVSVGFEAFEGTAWLKNKRSENLPYILLGSVLIESEEKEGDVVVPEGVSSIAGHVYSKCDGLLSVEMPDSVTHIGYEAFWQSTNLTSVKMSKGLVDIGYGAFGGCSSLSGIDIPEGVKAIGGNAFSETSAVSGPIKIPDSVEEIGFSAFHRCGMTGIELPKKITKLEDGMLADCHNITSIEIPESVTEIGDSVFSGCAITEIEIPETVTSIGNYTF